MDIIEIIAQCIGILGIATFIVMYQFSDMKSIRKAKLCMDVFWGVHYLLLGATAGFVANAVCFVRELVFIRSDRPGFHGKTWLCIFVSINIVSAILKWEGLYSCLPAIVSVFGTYGFWQKNVTRARWIAILCNILMFTYDIFIASYAGLIGETLAFISVVIAMSRSKKAV